MDDDDNEPCSRCGGEWYLQECDDPIQCCDPVCDGIWHPCTACQGHRPGRVSGDLVTGTRARGVCPECGRTIAGRASSVRWVILAPHTRTRSGGRHRGVPCLVMGGYRRVPRILT